MSDDQKPTKLQDILGDAPAFTGVLMASNFSVTAIRCDGNYWLLVDTDSRDIEWHTLDELAEFVEFVVPLREDTIPLPDDVAELRAANAELTRLVEHALSALNPYVSSATRESSREEILTHLRRLAGGEQ